MTEDVLVPALPPSQLVPVARVVSKARSLAAARSARRRSLMLGNHLALSHGCFAVTANEQDASIEVDLLYASHPGLDPISDRRLAEQLALASVQHRRALIAIEADGLTPTLTSYVTRLAALVERLEAKVHDRERERIAQMRRGDSMIIQLQKQAKR